MSEIARVWIPPVSNSGSRQSRHCLTRPRQRSNIPREVRGHACALWRLTQSLLTWLAQRRCLRPSGTRWCRQRAESSRHASSPLQPLPTVTSHDPPIPDSHPLPWNRIRSIAKPGASPTVTKTTAVSHNQLYIESLVTTWKLGLCESSFFSTRVLCQVSCRNTTLDLLLTNLLLPAHNGDYLYKTISENVPWANMRAAMTSWWRGCRRKTAAV